MSRAETHTQDSAPRMRLKTTIDFSKADPGCDRCHGKGIVRYDKKEVPGEGVISVPVVCRCVSRNGGVKEDAFDRMLDKLAQEVHSGAWARQFASDVLAMPHHRRDAALEGVEAQSADESKPVEVRDALCEAIKLIKDGIAAEHQQEG